MLNVVVAGASRGIGLGLVRAYLARGDRVFALVRDPAASPGLSDLARQYGERLQLTACDLNAPATPERIAAAFKDLQLDRVLLNAGISGPRERDLANIGETDIALLLLSNAVAPLRLARALRPLLRTGGVLTFTSSIMGSLQLSVGANMPLYSASKAALNSMLLHWAADLGESRDFSLLALHPGWVRTDMGGEEAPLSVEQSVAGLVEVVEAAAGLNECRFADHEGNTLPW